MEFFFCLFYDIILSNEKVIIMKERLRKDIEARKDAYIALVQDLYEHPELGNEEYRSMEVLASLLEGEGFLVDRGFVVPTGFQAVYKAVKPGPVIAYLCEYDALPEVGHGCGHNLIAGMSVGAGIALKSLLDEIGGEVRVIGTPAEENFGGKVSMAEAHVFDDVDAALMLHPDTKNGLGGRTLALYPLKFEFYGTNAHACTPQHGRSALDAAVTAYQSISLLRQFTEPNTYIHGIIRHGGEAANVIPAYASLEYYFRGTTMKYVKELSERAIDCVKGACMATDTTFKTSVYECPYEDCVINYELAAMLKQEFEELGYHSEGVDEVPSGSSDVGSVSYICPTLQGYIQIADPVVNGHSKEMAEATISTQGHKALCDGALMLSDIGRRLITEPETLRKVKQEFILQND